MVATRLDSFTRSYIECALWSSLDDDGEPLDGLYTVDDLSPECLGTMMGDCADFQAVASDLLATLDLSQSGHDFWLTRNHHGAGFWDRGLGEIGTKLTDLSHPYGSCDLYVGDDGRIHCG